MNDENFSHYIAHLKERRPEIADFLLRAERNHLAPEDYKAFGHCLRRLQELTQERNGRLHGLAMTMQEMLAASPAPAHEEMLAHCKRLHTACHDALVMSENANAYYESYAPPQKINLRSGKPLMLSIDDDRIVHHMIDGMFGEHVSILTAKDGLQGMEMIRQHTPDLVLLDDAMPGLTGMKLIEMLKADPRLSSTPVIMLTSSDRPQDIARANAAGAVNYIIKPFKPSQLADAVYQALWLRSLLGSVR